jgi:hypothetical protein
MEHYVGKKIIDGVVVGPKVDVSAIGDRLVVQEPLEASTSSTVTTATCCARRWRKQFRRWVNKNPVALRYEPETWVTL